MNIAILGAGAMGKMLSQLITETDNLGVADVIEPRQGQSLNDIADNVDVVIDFSHPENLEMVIEYCSNASCPAVIATTGHTPEQRKAISDLSKKVPVVFAANFSLGVTVMTKVLAQITPILEAGFDMEIIEKHHNKKIDSPSGTAKMLVKAMNPKNRYEEVFGRYGNRKRTKEIGVHAVRGGTIAGEHTAIFAGDDEILEIKHTAGSKKIFAVGAIKAAQFVRTAKPDLYDMEDVLFGHK